MTKLFSYAFMGLLAFNISCNNDGDDPVLPKGAYENGILVSNEGNYGKPNAEVSFIDGNLNAITNGVFGAENNSAKVGDVLQSIAFNGDNAYLVVNNSNKIEVVNRYTFKKVSEITEQVNQPRYAAFSSNYMYVTNAGDKSVGVYGIKDKAFVKKININDTAEMVYEVGGTIFVQNASYGFGNKITMISTADNTIKSTITVAKGNIQKTVPYNNSLYVLASGTVDSYIYQYNSTGTLAKTITLTGIANAAKLAIDQNKIYFTSGNKIYEMDINSATIPTKPIFSALDEGEFFTLYGFNVIDGKIYTSEVNGFTANSTVKVYSLTGNVLKTFTAGMGTNGFYKN